MFAASFTYFFSLTSFQRSPQLRKSAMMLMKKTDDLTGNMVVHILDIRFDLEDVLHKVVSPLVRSLLYDPWIVIKDTELLLLATLALDQQVKRHLVSQRYLVVHLIEGRETCKVIEIGLGTILKVDLVSLAQVLMRADEQNYRALVVFLLVLQNELVMELHVQAVIVRVQHT